MRTSGVVFYLGLIYLCPPAIVLGMGRRRFHRDNVQYDDTCSRDCSQTVSKDFLKKIRLCNGYSVVFFFVFFNST